MPRSYERSRSEERVPNLKVGDEGPKGFFFGRTRPLAGARGSSLEGAVKEAEIGI